MRQSVTLYQDKTTEERVRTSLATFRQNHPENEYSLCRIQIHGGSHYQVEYWALLKGDGLLGYWKTDRFGKSKFLRFQEFMEHLGQRGISPLSSRAARIVRKVN